MRLIYPFLPFAAALLVAGAARAEGVTVPLDHSRRLNIRGEAASVIVGNPGIADVTVVDSHTVYISGHAYGSTDVVVTDHGGRAIYVGEISVTRPMATVSLYRGPMRSDFTCTGECSAATRADPNGAPKADLNSADAISGISQPAKP